MQQTHHRQKLVDDNAAAIAACPRLSNASPLYLLIRRWHIRRIEHLMETTSEMFLHRLAGICQNLLPQTPSSPRADRTGGCAESKDPLVPDSDKVGGEASPEGQLSPVAAA